MTPANANCGWRHLKLVGLITMIVLVVVGASFKWTDARLNGYDARLREVERANARIEERLEAIQETCRRIEGKLP